MKEETVKIIKMEKICWKGKHKNKNDWPSLLERHTETISDKNENFFSLFLSPSASSSSSSFSLSLSFVIELMFWI